MSCDGYLTKVKLELAQVFHLNWNEGLHLDLVAINSCELSCASGVPAHRNVSWVCSRFLLPWAQILQKKPSRLNLTLGPHVNIM